MTTLTRLGAVALLRSLEATHGAEVLPLLMAACFRRDDAEFLADCEPDEPDSEDPTERAADWLNGFLESTDFMDAIRSSTQE